MSPTSSLLLCLTNDGRALQCFRVETSQLHSIGQVNLPFEAGAILLDSSNTLWVTGERVVPFSVQIESNGVQLIVQEPQSALGESLSTGLQEHLDHSIVCSIQMVVSEQFPASSAAAATEIDDTDKELGGPPEKRHRPTISEA